MSKERAWIDRLRGMGVTAAHPDDGWVDRSVNTARLQYPRFNDGLKVGDLLALGSPERFRVVLAVKFIQDGPLRLDENSGVWKFITEAVD